MKKSEQTNEHEVFEWMKSPFPLVFSLVVKAGPGALIVGTKSSGH